MRRIYSRAFVSIGVVLALALGSAALAESSRSARLFGSEVDQDAVLDVIATAPSRSFKPVGHTSVVLRMRTVARVTAALKVRSRAVPDGYRSEIAAYRIARLLGLDNVPPAVSRDVSWNEIRRRFHEDKLAQRPRLRRAILWDEDGSAPGAAIQWVRGMRSVGLEDPSTWSKWLADADIPADHVVLARDLSAMVVFDLLIGNWDRFSGGNLPSDAARERAILRDHDRAFSTPLLERRYERLLAALTRTKRFSRSVVERLSALTEDAVRVELAHDPSHPAHPLLDDAQLHDVFARRATILSYIAALVEERGEEAVLVFP